MLVSQLQPPPAVGLVHVNVRPYYAIGRPAAKVDGVAQRVPLPSERRSERCPAFVVEVLRWYPNLVHELAAKRYDLIFHRRFLAHDDRHELVGVQQNPGLAVDALPELQPADRATVPAAVRRVAHADLHRSLLAIPRQRLKRMELIAQVHGNDLELSEPELEQPPALRPIGIRAFPITAD